VVVEGAVESLTKYINEREADWWIDIFKPDEAVQEAMRQSQGASRPVVIADTQDNPGAGGNSNTTGMLRALVANQAQDAALGVLFDPEAAEAAHKTGIGKTITLGLGGEPALGDQPFEGTFTVEHLSEGNLTVKGPMMRGAKMNLGPTACLQIGGVRVVVGSTHHWPLDRQVTFAQMFNSERPFKWLIPQCGFPTQTQCDGFSNSSFMGRFCSFWIKQYPKGSVLSLIRHQGPQHSGGVRVATCSRIVLSVCNYHWAAGSL
jgi:hypothetical protein